MATGVEERSKKIEESEETSASDLEPTQQMAATSDESEEKDPEQDEELEGGTVLTQPVQAQVTKRLQFGNKSPRPEALVARVHVLQGLHVPASSQVFTCKLNTAFFIYIKKIHALTFR